MIHLVYAYTLESAGDFDAYLIPVHAADTVSAWRAGLLELAKRVHPFGEQIDERREMVEYLSKIDPPVPECEGDPVLFADPDNVWRFVVMRAPSSPIELRF